MPLRPIRILTGLFMLCACLLTAQLDISHFERYNTLDGLNHNHVTSITQDSAGFIWVGTENGPLRFDGTRFVSLVSLNPAYADKEIYIVKLTTISKNELGVATTYGAFVLNTDNYQFTSLDYKVDDPLTTWAYNTYDVQKDTKGNYGVSTKIGFYVYDSGFRPVVHKQVYTTADIGTAWMLYGRNIVLTPDGELLQKNSEGYSVFDNSTNHILENPAVFHLDTALFSLDKEIHFAFIDQYDLAYFSNATEKLYLHDLQSGMIKSYPVPEEISENLNWFSKIIVRDDSTLLINAKKGAYIIHYDAKQKTLRLSPELQLPETEVSSFYVDRDGRLWIGTYAGLLKEKSVQPVTQFPLTFGENNELIRVKWLEKDEGIWYASALKDGLLILDDQQYKILDRKIFYEDGQPVGLAKMLRYDQDHLWICTSAGLMEYDIRNGSYARLTFNNHPDWLETVVVHDIFEDSDQNIWLASNEGNRVYKIDRETRLIQCVEYNYANPKFRVNIVYRFGEDAAGNIWFCGDAMARYNVKTGMVDSLVEKLPLQHNQRKVFILHRNSKDVLWIGTNGENWHTYSDQEGWHVVGDSKISPDPNKYQCMIGDDLYFISRLGKIVTLNTLTNKYRILSAFDGWDQEKITSLGFFKDPGTGNIVFSGDNVMYRFTPDATVSHKVNAPFITEISVQGGKNIHLPKGELTFASNENNIRLKFLTLNYDDPSNQLFAYRLKENDNTDWITVEQPEINLTEIPPGRYNLELQVSSRNNDWPPAYRTYPLFVRFPFYLQGWFIVSMVLAIVGALWLIIRSRLKRVKFISNLDRQVIEYELKALHAQMNPHFVFNCLNSIKEMIMSKDNKNANIYLNKFSFLLRSTLDQSKLTFVSLSHTIEYLRNYLEMEKLRFSHFEYSIDVSKDIETESVMMAPLLLQPIVENAIWHGQSDQKDLERLCLRFYVCTDDVVCEVEDNGIGINATRSSQSSGMHLSSALDNIRKRIDLLNRKHDLDYRLSIIDKSDINKGHGTIVKLMFKYKNYAFD